MKDILLRHENLYVECELEGLKFTYTYSDDPNRHYVLTLRGHDFYPRLKKAMHEYYESHDNKLDGYTAACELFLGSSYGYKFFTNDLGYCYCDLRDREEIYNYEKEASDKVWLMRCCDIARRHPVYEVSREAMNRILSTYNDIPRTGYTDWECGYWNGIMGALRWVLGEEKDFLDT